VEDFLSHADITDPRLQELRQAICDAGQAHTDVEDHAPFLQALHAGLPQQARALLDQAQADGRMPATFEEAERAWGDGLLAYDDIRQEIQIKALEERLGRQWEDGLYNQLIELKKSHLEARARRRFAPPESDVA
jgi:hypothetical protein